MTANGEQWAAELDQLRAETHTVRVTTSAAQMASHRRALLVARLHKQGVPTRAMADALGVTPAAIRHLIYRVAATTVAM